MFQMTIQKNELALSLLLATFCIAVLSPFFIWDFFFPSDTMEMSVAFPFPLFHPTDTRKQICLREQDD